MKKIALFLPDLEGGGAQRIVLTLAKGFVARGIEVDLVLIKAEGPFLPDVPENINLINLLDTSNSRSLLGALAAVYKLMRYLRHEHPDFLISSMSRPNILASIAKFLSNTKVQLILREDNTELNVSDFPTRLGMRWFYHRANGCIAVSKGVKQDLMKVFSVPCEKIYTAYNPVDIHQVALMSKEEVKHPWFQSEDVPIVVGVGRLVKQKDFFTLIRAFAVVRTERKLKLVILGEGPLRVELEKLVYDLNIKNDVWMPGFVSNPYAYMKRSDVFALSSKWEGLGVVIIEAIALGMQVVSTDCHSGPAEILDNGRYGKLVPVGDVNALANAVLDAFDESVEKTALYDRAEEFSPEKLVPQYLNILSSIVSN